MEEKEIKICPLTGKEEPTEFKKMCLNCKYSSANFGHGETNTCFCKNEQNMTDFIENLKKEIKGYEIEEIKLKPRPLKDTSKRCPRWELDEEHFIAYAKEHFA